MSCDSLRAIAKTATAPPLWRADAPAAVHDVKAAIRQVDLAACRKLTSAALELASPREVRDLVSASKK
jgi:signal transduction protein with GAF and PtsI domain